MRRRAFDVAARARVACSSTLARERRRARGERRRGREMDANARYSTKTFADVVPGRRFAWRATRGCFDWRCIHHETETEALEVEVRGATREPRRSSA